MTALSEARQLAIAHLRAAWMVYRIAQRHTPNLVTEQRRYVRASIRTLRLIRRAEGV